MIWKSKYPSNPNRSSNLKAVLQLLEEFFGTGIIDPSAGPGNRRTRNSITLVENNVAGNVNMAALYTQEKALSFANVRLEKYAETDKEFLIGLIGDNLQPNVIYAEALTRSEERRVGKECVSTCSTRGSPSH